MDKVTGTDGREGGGWSAEVRNSDKSEGGQNPVFWSDIMCEWPLRGRGGQTGQRARSGNFFHFLKIFGRCLEILWALRSVLKSPLSYFQHSKCIHALNIQNCRSIFDRLRWSFLMFSRILKRFSGLLLCCFFEVFSSRRCIVFSLETPNF